MNCTVCVELGDIMIIQFTVIVPSLQALTVDINHAFNCQD